MGTFQIEGGHQLKGSIQPQGAKNEALQILCAVLLTPEKVVIDNIPDIVDVNKLINILSNLGVKIQKLGKGKYSFKSEHIKTCFSTYNFKENIKNIIRNYPFLYNVAKKLERTLFPSIIKRDAYVSAESSIENNEIQKFDDEMPFIQGIINQENTNLSLTRIDTEESILEYSNWHRSHGGNWNTKYDSNNYINHNNISKLNLIWEYSSIDNLDNQSYKIQKNKWKQKMY